MSYRETVLSRERLYELVWSMPVMAAAERYGLTGTGLAKICARLLVPVPPRGYWARVQAGQDVAKSPLSAPRRGQPVEHRFQRWLSDEAAFLEDEDVRSDLEGDFAQLGKPEVAADLSRLHPVLLDSVALLQETDDVAATLREHPCADISVGPDLLDRALRVLDALFRVLEGSGFTPEVTPPTPLLKRGHGAATYDALPSRTLVKRGDAAIAIVVNEERRVWGGIEKQVLTLRLREPEHGVAGSSWSDTNGSALESHLTEIARAIVRHATVKQGKANAQRHHAELERRREETLEQARQNRRQAQDLQLRVGAWNQARELQVFLDALERAGRESIASAAGIRAQASRRAALLVSWATRPAS